MNGLLGKKIGATQIFTENGRLEPATLIEVGPCDIVQIKADGKDGYSAVQLGFLDAKPKNVNKPAKGHFKSVTPKRYLREFRIDEAGIKDMKVGDRFSVDIFNKGDFVDIRGTSKGKGFQGGVRRWGFRGGPGGHGSMHHRAPGSIGSSSFPSRVFKGQHLPGRMGGDTITTQNLRILDIDKENNLLTVKGAVPGHKDSLVVVTISKKKKRKGVSDGNTKA